MKSIVHAIWVAGCLTVGTPLMAENLAGSEWIPTEVKGEAFEPVQEVFLRFEQDGRYFGNAGCNTFRGAFVTNENAILLGPAAATMMACPDEILQQEFVFLQNLMEVRHFKRDGAILELKDLAGAPLLRFAQRDAD